MCSFFRIVLEYSTFITDFFLDQKVFFVCFYFYNFFCKRNVNTFYLFIDTYINAFLFLNNYINAFLLLPYNFCSTFHFQYPDGLKIYLTENTFSQLSFLIEDNNKVPLAPLP